MVSKPTTPSWCFQLPKSELHAHLNGSIRGATLAELLDKPCHAKLKEQASGLLEVGSGRTLKYCFELFPVIHELITDVDVLAYVTRQVLNDFAEENTIYLELRTTPKPCHRMTAREYLETVLNTIAKYHNDNPDGLVCRLLISLCRHRPVAEAEKSILLVEQLINLSPLHRGLIVGFELSGNPRKGQWSDFRPLLEDVRNRLELPVSLHFGEVTNEEECLSMLDFHPERVGHAVLLTEKVAKRLIKMEPKVGVEVCLTSNLLTESVRDVAEHPVSTLLLPEKHPFCLCTDDCGIFDTTLSEEYGRLVNCHSFDFERAKEIAIQGLNLAFCRDRDLMEKLQWRAKMTHLETDE